jgi:hypothetical protein
VKEKLREEERNYRLFLNRMHAYKTGKITPKAVIP